MKISLISIMVILGCWACSYTLKVKDGRTAHDRKQFALAIPMLEKEIPKAKTRKEKGEMAFLLGDSYLRTGQDELALRWFQMAYDNNYGPDALKSVAFTQKKLERYADARESFKNLGIEIGSPYEYKKEITACTIVEAWAKDQTSSGIKTESSDFNSPQNDFAPLLFKDGRLIFTSDRGMSAGKENYNWTGRKFMDIFIVDPNNASPQIFDGQINTENNEGTPCFDENANEMFFVRAAGAYKGDDAFCKIYRAELAEGGGWTSPVPLQFQKEKVNYIHPTLSRDGNTLYFACNDSDGWGGYDIYGVQRNVKIEGGWEEPKLLSRSVNTLGNDLFPSFDKDTLYFASDGHIGMGGLDIFRTYKTDKNAWLPPINLKAPLNSGADDFGFLVTEKTSQKPTELKPGDLIRKGFFTSNRAGGRGGDDIYRFEQKVPPPKPPKVDTTPPKALVYKIVLEGYVLEKIFTIPNDPNSKVLGRKPLSGAVVQYELGGKKQKITLKDDGYFKLELTENTDYNFAASMAGFLSNSAKFSTKGIAKDPENPIQSFEIEIVLDKIFRNQEIVLENIYYDYDKWDIRPDAEPTLTRLAEVLRQNPDIKIQLGSHTDCRGGDGYNRTLSQRRAESAVNYLIGKGIDANRLSAVGYGEAQPADLCNCSKCSEASHQTNRRTTFKVVE